MKDSFHTVTVARPSARDKASVHRRKTSIVGALLTLWRYIESFFSLASQRSKLLSADVCFIPYPAYIDLIYFQILLLGRKRPLLVIDAFLCLHDTLVADRGLVASSSFLARVVFWLEKRTLSAADLIFIDTQEQKHLLVDNYDIDEERVRVTPVGIDESLWAPLDPLPLDEGMEVIFWGTFIPLHGVKTIVEAARILEQRLPNVRITLVGDGQTARETAELIAVRPCTNLIWERRLVKDSELRRLVEKAHCVLGVFGESAKAGNVIPYKVYQAMASNKVLISRSGSAMKSLIGKEGEVSAVITVNPGDAAALADALCHVWRNYAEISRGPGSRAIYEAKLSNDVLRRKLEKAMDTVLSCPN